MEILFASEEMNWVVNVNYSVIVQYVYPTNYAPHWLYEHAVKKDSHWTYPHLYQHEIKHYWKIAP